MVFAHAQASIRRDSEFGMNRPMVVPQARAQVSRRERLQALYEAHHDPVWRLLRGIGLDEARASDATHQVFLVAMERLDDIREESERAFLCSAAIRIAKKLGSRQGREGLVEELPEVQGGQQPDEVLDQERQRRLLERFLAKLTEDLRVALVLHEIEGYTQKEIAQMLDIPEGTAASRLRRAREAFDALVDAHLDGGAP